MSARDLEKTKDIEEEVFETQNVADDYDQINIEKLTFNKFAGSAYHQQSQHIDQDPVTIESSGKIFGQESN